MSIITIGIDLAKNVFAVHGVDEDGKVALVKPKVSREQLLPLIAQLPPCRIGMEACYGAHHWARRFVRQGHAVRLLPASDVRPYVRGNKTDRNDARALAQIMRTGWFRQVHVKSRQCRLWRSLLVARRTVLNEMRSIENVVRAILREGGLKLGTPARSAHTPRTIRSIFTPAWPAL